MGSEMCIRDRVVSLSEEETAVSEFSRDELIGIGAAPDDSVISEWEGCVRAIILSHAHLDHIGAVPYLASKYRCPIFATPYTIGVLKSLFFDEGIKIRNHLKQINPNSRIRISNNIVLEFINITHSTLQTVVIALHTKIGSIIYANDYKFDNHPIVGKRPNYKRLGEISKRGVIALITDSLYSDKRMKTPSEKVAREMLKDVMLGTNNTGKAVFVTTFASHIARLKSIVDFAKMMNRKIVFLGRSLGKYTNVAQKLNLISFGREVEIYSGRRKVDEKLKDINRNREKYVVVCTGNQGEPNSTLCRVAYNETPFKFGIEDQVIFSCKTIPDPVNTANRAMLEDKLEKQNVRIFKDIHVSGHAAREDHRDFIHLLKPQHIIPAHGDVTKLTAMAELATELGYVLGETVHITRDGQKMEII